MKANAVFSGLTRQVHRLADLVRQNRMIAALEEGVARYPVFRVLRFAARVDLEVLLDAIALQPGWRAERMSATAVILDGDGVFVSGWGTRKADYCTCVFEIWAADVSRAADAKEKLLAKAGATRITEPMFSIDWNFLCGNTLESAEIEELANERLYDRAYPEIKEGVQAFIARYLAAPEAVLVLQGPPGTGKTRLIRAILGEMSRRKLEPARAIYTGDMKALAADEIYVKFITGEDDAFVVEDADHLLKPRADGNEHLHRFLTIADGVVRAQGRKIIFSTNLPNVGDLDDALVRPGRCFARVAVRNLSASEAQALAHDIASGEPEKLARAAALGADAGRKRSVAEVYKALQ